MKRRWIRGSITTVLSLALAHAQPSHSVASPQDVRAPANVEAQVSKEGGFTSFSHASGSSITSDGPLTEIQISDQLNCAVNHADDAFGAFYGDTACATLIAANGVLYGPEAIPAGLFPDAVFAPVSQTPVTGSGTPVDPFTITTVVDAGSNLRVTQTDTYEVGRDSYQTAVHVQNNSLSQQSVVIYRAADCYLQDSDDGFGARVVTSGAVSCVSSDDGGLTPGNRSLQWDPLTSGSSHMQGEYWEVWEHVATRTPFPNTIRADMYVDNGAGLSWEVAVSGGGSVTVAHATTVTSKEDAPLAFFVHGYGAPFDDVGFEHLLDELETRYGAERVDVFQHYQDAGYRNPDGSCATQPDVILPEEPNGGMPVDLDSIDPELCDSWADIALSSVMLHADIVERYERSNRKILLIANSMGAAIARGMLTYSSKRGDGVAEAMIDSVVFLQGAHDGSQASGAAINHLPRDVVEHDLAFAGGHRPAFRNLAPQSEWYGWANPGIADLPDLPYYNVFGDMDWVELNCFLVWCSELMRLEYGDGIMAAGTDDPFDTPYSGGARFLHGPMGEENWQWSLPHEETIVLGANLNGQRLSAAVRLSLQPEYHGNFGDRMDEISVADCVTGQEVPLTEALLNVIRGRMDGEPHRCTP